MFGRRPDSTYQKSQAATSLPKPPTPVARGLALAIAECGEEPKERKRLAQLLVDELNAGYGLAACEIVVADRAQVHEHNGQRLQSKTYGYYRCVVKQGGITGARIRIYHRTARLKKVISPKVFLNTVLHEWVHHYDFAGLRLARSPHTAGFYTRLRALADSLQVGFVLPPEPDAANQSGAA